MAVALKYLLAGVLWSWAAWRGHWSLPMRLVALYSGATLVGISSLFFLRRFNGLLGKSAGGVIPWWSLALFWPFHLFTRAEIYAKRLLLRAKVPDASEVVPNLYVGGWFADWAASEAGLRWHCIVDLTTEYGERAWSEVYLCAPVWDGNPPTPADIDRCAQLLVESAAKGPTLCHCASGIGRSATVTCAALVKGGHAPDLPAALALLQQRRHVVRLNAKMRAALAAWAREYAPGTAAWQDKDKGN